MTDHSLLLESPPPGWTLANFSDISNRIQDAVSPSTKGNACTLASNILHEDIPPWWSRERIRCSQRQNRVSQRRYLVRQATSVPSEIRAGKRDGICSTDILVFRATKNCIPEYLCLLTHTDEFVGHAKATTSGVQHPRTSWPCFERVQASPPSVPEQQKIAAMLGLVQRAIEQQERLIALTTELKKSLMHKLFTEGVCGERQKQTEIGPVPESWLRRSATRANLTASFKDRPFGSQLHKQLQGGGTCGESNFIMVGIPRSTTIVATVSHETAAGLRAPYLKAR